MALSSVAVSAIFALIVWLYSPALNGHFIFDDLALPFCKPLRHASLSA